jgi:hypothetical protein
MKRYVLTIFDGVAPTSQIYIDASAAIKEWLRYTGSDRNSVDDWIPSLKNSGHLSFSDPLEGDWAVIVETEIF